MNTNQKKYTAFMESVCKEFNCPEAIPALNAGFKAFCEANDYYYGSNKYWYCDDPDDNNPETCIIPKGEKDLYKMVTINVPEVNAELVPPGTAPYYKPFPKYRFTYNMDPSADGYRQNLDILSKMMQLGFRNISISNEAPYTAYFSYAQGTTDKYDQKSALESAKKIFNSWRMNRTDHPQTHY